MISAMLADGTYFDSLPDSSHSTDEIAPGVPANINAGYAAGGTALTWNSSSEPDFQYYRVYRGGT